MTNNYVLKVLSSDLDIKELYDMYQDIPNDDNGQANGVFEASGEEKIINANSAMTEDKLNRFKTIREFEGHFVTTI